jgi:predicted DNA-binding protein with PD1-like motif
MKTSPAKIGRVFVIRLEHGDKMPGALEEFARRKRVKRGFCILVGGADRKSRIVVGPKNPDARPVVPLEHVLTNVYETTGVGTLFPDQKGRPVLHMHVSFGRRSKALTGCIRPGIRTWAVGEVILVELKATGGTRKKDKKTGFTLLDPR